MSIIARHSCGCYMMLRWDILCSSINRYAARVTARLMTIMGLPWYYAIELAPIKLHLLWRFVMGGKRSSTMSQPRSISPHLAPMSLFRCRASVSPQSPLQKHVANGDETVRSHLLGKRRFTDDGGPWWDWIEESQWRDPCLKIYYDLRRAYR
jgi:hypothetical protein